MSIELKQAAQQAIEAIQDLRGYRPDIDKAIEALRAAIQQAEAKTDEPTAYVCPTSHHAHDGSMEDGPDYLEWADEASDYEKRVGTPLYTHPAPGVPDGYVLVPLQVLHDASDALGNFIMDHGWGDADMQAMDNLDAHIARHIARHTAAQEPS